MPPPNVVIILADQLSQFAVGAYAGSPRRTPHIDRLAGRGTIFTNAYTSCPLCVPARASLWTGLHPHQTGIEANTRTRLISGEVATMGMLFTGAGYRCLHFGKTHDAGALRGFRTLDFWHMPVRSAEPWKSYHGAEIDRYTRRQAARFLRTARDRPFLLVADFVNPHDICDWVGDHAGPHTDEPLPSDLPPLPGNFHCGDLANRPDPVRNNAPHNKRVGQTEGWTEENWRHYLAAYFHYVAMVDSEIGRVLDAVEDRPDARDTIIVLLSDHGEGMAAHRFLTKGATFYGETMRIPLILSGPGIKSGRCVRSPIVSMVDILPTLCGLAEIQTPAAAAGTSFVPLLRGRKNFEWCSFALATWGEPNSSAWARMLRTAKYKYTCYAAGGEEELYNLENDPGETRNLARDPDSAAALREHRRLLREHGRRFNDPFPVPS